MNSPTISIDHVFRTAADQSRDAVLISDSQNRVIYVNDMFTKVTGYTKSDVIGKNPKILKSGVQADEFYTKMWATIKKNGEWKGELWNRSKDGKLFFEYQHIFAVKDENGQTSFYISIFYDRTRQIQEAQQKRYLKLYDEVTELPNKRRLKTYLENIASENTTPFNYVSVNYLNLNDINSTYGTDCGDKYLKEIAKRMRLLGSKKFFASRIGGGLFALVTPSLQSKSRQLAAIRELVNLLNKPIDIDDIKIFPQVEIGILENAQSVNSPQEILLQTDLSLYREGTSLKRDFFFVNHLNQDKAKKEFMLAQRIQAALNNDEFEIFYQPQVTSDSHEIIGAEALIRWFTDDGMISPGEFLPVAEKYSLLSKLDEYVINKVFQDINTLRNKGVCVPKIAINMSDQLIPLHVLESLMNTHNIQPSDFELEITEKLIANNNEELNNYLQSLAAMGVHTSIDDFGTGYSSLARLRHLKVNKLKIDKSFVDHIENSAQDREILMSIVGIGKALKLVVLAEGVETSDQKRFLTQCGCDQIQGYLFYKPTNRETFGTLLAPGRPVTMQADSDVVPDLQVQIITS